MLICDYNGNYYLKINGLKIRELPGEIEFKKDNPYIMELTFSKYDFQKNGEQITGYSMSEINKYIIIIYIYNNGIIRISFKTF